jgi:hypothetical protein
MKAYTDYPMLFRDGLIGGCIPIRRVEVLSYDGNKYCMVKYRGKTHSIKVAYLYKTKRRFEYDKETGYSVEHIDLSKLPIERE